MWVSAAEGLIDAARSTVAGVMVATEGDESAWAARFALLEEFGRDSSVVALLSEIDDVERGRELLRRVE